MQMNDAYSPSTHSSSFEFRNLEAPPLVVGAGPTGLAVALDPVRFGIPCRLIDRLPEPLSHSRAVSIQARTLEMFQQRQCIELFLRLGHKGRIANFYAEGRRFFQLNFNRLQSRYQYLLWLDQTKTERILTDKLAELGGSIERGVKLTEFEDTGESVRVTLKHADGREENTKADFLVGADSAHSKVREGLHLQFEGKTYEQTFVLADVHVEWDFPEDEFYIFASEEGLTSIFNLGNGIYRLIADSTSAPTGDKPSLAECQALLDRRIHHQARLSDLRWSSYFHVNSRRVEKIRVGRVFLAGDAAHIHNPATGQGMNTGIQEGLNLAWKLALVLRGEANNRLLDTYDEERRPIEKQVVSATEVVFGVAGAKHGPLHFFRDHVAPHFETPEALQDFGRRFISEIGIEYRSSSLSLSGSGSELHAGDRVPDAPVQVTWSSNGQSGPCLLYELFDPARFSLFAFNSANTQQSAELDNEISQIKGLLPSLNIFKSTHDAVRDTRADTHPFNDSSPYSLLIRPDGYLMTQWKSGEADRVLAFLNRWFARQPSGRAAAA